MHVFVLLVVSVWVLLGARSVGGFDRLVAMAAEQDTYAAKAAILDNKLFPGMRLLYTGLIVPWLLRRLRFRGEPSKRRPDPTRHA